MMTCFYGTHLAVAERATAILVDLYPTADLDGYCQFPYVSILGHSEDKMCDVSQTGV